MTKIYHHDGHGNSKFMYETDDCGKCKKLEKVLMEIRDYEHDDHLDVVGGELQNIAKEALSISTKNTVIEGE